jgi:hypothetical protein
MRRKREVLAQKLVRLDFLKGAQGESRKRAVHEEHNPASFLPAKRQPRLQMSTEVVYNVSPSSSSGARYQRVTT